jgi:regulatory protein YycI of two-component signal transduction system YycFG
MFILFMIFVFLFILLTLNAYVYLTSNKVNTKKFKWVCEEMEEDLKQIYEI